MTDIPTPQTPTDAREFIYGLDASGNILHRQVGSQDLDWRARFGTKVNSTSQQTISTGIKTFTTDTSVSKIKVGDQLQCTALPDPTNAFMIGTVVNVGTTSSPATVKIVIDEISDTTGTYQSWELQVIGRAQPGSGTIKSYAIGYSESTVAVGAGEKTFTTQSGLSWSRACYVRATDMTNAANYMQGVVTSYSGTSVVIHVVSQYGGSGSPSIWILEQVAPALEFFDPSLNLNAAGVTIQHDQNGLQVLSNTIGQLGYGDIKLEHVGVSGHGADITFDLAGASKKLTMAGDWSGTHTGTSSGTNTGDQTIALTGDVTGSGTGSFAATIKTNVALAGNPTTTTQSAGNNSTRIATTAYVDTAITNYSILRPIAAYSATITPTAVTGAALSWDTAADTCLWSTTHGLSVGTPIILVTNAPAGTTNLTPYYVNAIDSTHFSLHLTYLDALTATNLVNITSSTLTTIRKLVYTNEYNWGLSTNGTVGGVTATAAVGLVFNLANNSINSAAAQLTTSGLVSGATTYTKTIPCLPSSVSGQTVTYVNANLYNLTNPAAAGVFAVQPSTWSAQGTTAFTVNFVCYGSL